MPLNPFRKRNREHRDKKPRYAEGGPIQGPGAPNDDSILARLGDCTYYIPHEDWQPSTEPTWELLGHDGDNTDG